MTTPKATPRPSPEEQAAELIINFLQDVGNGSWDEQGARFEKAIADAIRLAALGSPTPRLTGFALAGCADKAGVYMRVTEDCPGHSLPVAADWDRFAEAVRALLGTQLDLAELRKHVKFLRSRERATSLNYYAKELGEITQRLAALGSEPSTDTKEKD